MATRPGLATDVPTLSSASTATTTGCLQPLQKACQRAKCGVYGFQTFRQSVRPSRPRSCVGILRCLLSVRSAEKHCLAGKTVMEMKANQTLRHRGSGIPMNLPTTTPLHQELALQTNFMDKLTVRPTLLEVASLQSQPCPFISIPLLIPGMCDTLLILHQLVGGLLQITSGAGCLPRLLLFLCHHPLVETFFPDLIDRLLVPGTQISTGAVDCRLLDMTMPHVLLTCLIHGILHHRCRITPINRHSHRR